MITVCIDRGVKFSFATYDTWQNTTLKTMFTFAFFFSSFFFEEGRLKVTI